MTTVTFTLAEDLLKVLMSAESITDAQKDAYISEVLAGRIPEELRKDWDGFLAREERIVRERMVKREEDIVLAQGMLNEAEQDIANQEAAQASAFQKNAELLVTNFKQECVTIERNLDQGLEQDQKTHVEASEEAAIRQMLQGKPQDKAGQ